MKESVFANLGKRGTVSGKERSTVKSVPGENKKIFILIRDINLNSNFESTYVKT